MPNHKGGIAINRIDLTGQKIGFFEVTGRTETKGKLLFWECVCVCGKAVWRRSQHLRIAQSTHCGCRRVWGQTATHRMSGTRTYQSWLGMKARCADPANKIYGAAGVRVCERWRNSFENFLADMGECPEGHSIDRIENDGNYQPQNCRWATRMVQADNKRNIRRFEVCGELFSLPQLSRRTGIKYATLYRRMVLNNWAIPRALLGGGWEVEEF